MWHNQIANWSDNKDKNRAQIESWKKFLSTKRDRIVPNSMHTRISNTLNCRWIWSLYRWHQTAPRLREGINLTTNQKTHYAENKYSENKYYDDVSSR